MNAESSTSAGSIKRKRTGRACDYCRLHRIRCDRDDHGDRCKHCIEYGLSCESVAPAPKHFRIRQKAPNNDLTAEAEAQGLEPGYLGQSSISNIIRSTLFAIPLGRLDSFDETHDYYRGSIKDESGLLFGREVPHGGSRASIANGTEQDLALTVSSEAVLSSLFSTFQSRILPVFPVISASESVGPGPPPESYWQYFTRLDSRSKPHSPLPRMIKLALCALPSLSRTVPESIRRSLLYSLRAAMDSLEFEKLMRTSSLSNIQTWMLLTMSDELHADDGATAKSLLWQRSGRGVRSALELGLHRDVDRKVVPIGQIHRRRRVWGGCVIADRNLAVRFGQAMSFNSEDCDVPPPWTYPDHMLESAPLGTPCFQFFSYLTTLSELLGRAYRLTFTPSRWKYTTDVALYVLQNDFGKWHASLPDEWPYSPIMAVPCAKPLLDLFAISAEFTFLWPFLDEESIAGHIQFRPTAESLPGLKRRAQSAVQFLSDSGSFYLDVWSMMIYPAFVCMVLLCYSYREENDPETYMSLEQGVEVFRCWSQYRQLGDRRKILQAVELLRDSVVGEQPMNFASIMSSIV